MTLVNQRPEYERAKPEDQVGTQFTYTPLEVHIWNEGGDLDRAGLDIVKKHFGVTRKSDLPKPLGKDVHTAGGYGVGMVESTTKEFDELLETVDKTWPTALADQPKRVVRRKVSGQVGGAGAALFSVVDVALPLLTVDQKEHFFKQLAEELGYEME